MGGFVLTNNSQKESDIVAESTKVFNKHTIINFGNSGYKAIVFEKNLINFRIWLIRNKKRVHMIPRDGIFIGFCIA